MLQVLGRKVIWSGGVPWYLYNGFLRPAFLPHACPPISEMTARYALKQAGAAFARWEHPIDAAVGSAWWQTNRSGDYSRADLSGNTRSKVRRGEKRLRVRKPTTDEIIEQAFTVCESAVQRYGVHGFLPARGYPERLAEAVDRFPAHFEMIAVFDGNRMVAFSENHIQADAVLCESIWFDPGGLRDYSSYALFDYMLNHYLNDRKMHYVSDGVRRLHHETGIHSFLTEKFGFQRSPAELRVVYSAEFKILVYAAFPFRKILHTVSRRIRLSTLKKASGILNQEAIRRGMEVLP